jgi:acetyl-CoA C-acetyltransferase
MMPVLIGAGQLTDHGDPETGATPVELMAEAARRAAADAGPARALLDAVDAMVAVGLVVDSPDSNSAAARMYRNPPQTVCNLLGIDPPHKRYSHVGGNTPQMLVGRYASMIAAGECSAVLLTGAEALSTMIGRLKRGLPLDDAWRDDPGGEPQMIGDPRGPTTEEESRYGLQTPANSYPLFENALRGRYGWTLEQHRQHLGELFAGFNAVAADNPLAWFPTLRSAEEIAAPTASNRYVGFPYTKYLNSVIQVNQGAAVIMTSLARARELGVAEDRLVFLHGHADAHDIWFLRDRIDYCSSPAIRSAGSRALQMAGKRIADMDFLDIYSCFPSAVQVACDELGIAHDDPRGLTVTGGLPYFGGCGNNYVMHALATMMDRLRAKPGSFGLLNGNGWLLTKHAVGVYSTTPVSGDWQCPDGSDEQQAIDAAVHPAYTETPSGSATIETYTVVHGRQGAERAIVIGRLDDGTRFLSETPAEPALLERMTTVEMLGTRGTVSRQGDRNIFIPDLEEIA